DHEARGEPAVCRHALGSVDIHGSASHPGLCSACGMSDSGGARRATENCHRAAWRGVRGGSFFFFFFFFFFWVAPGKKAAKTPPSETLRGGGVLPGGAKPA